jgi:hypothetical protein
MKRSQSNWEEKIAGKLRGATSKPENYVWGLLEMELDNQLIAAKKRNYKIAAVAAILLLITSNLLLFWPSGSAELAEFNRFSFPENTVAVHNSAVDGDFAILKDNQQLNGRDKIAVNESPLKTTESKVVYASTQNDIETIANSILKGRTFDSNLNKERNTQSTWIASADLNSADQKIELLQLKAEKALADYFSNTKHSKSRHLMENEVWMSDSKTALFAHQQMGILNSHQQLKSINNSDFTYAIQDKNALVYRAIDLSVLSEESSIVAAVETTEKGAQQHWLANAEEELSEWQNVVETSKIDDVPLTLEDEILKELVGEAELEKKDPLSMLQEEAQDLYYAKTINKGLHFGLITGVQNNWLSKNSRNSEISRDAAKRLFSPGYQVGFNFGYDFAEHFGIMAEFKYSDESARFHNEAKDRLEHLDLKYLEVPIYFKVKHSKPTANMKPMVFNYLIGVQYRDLRSVDSYIEGSTKRFGQDYNTSEWGVTAGFDFDYYFSKNLFLTVGTRASVNGAASNFPRINDAAGTGTLNYSVGVYTRFNFRLLGR